ncbi:MAG: hypothetical protein CBB68_06355 [Rhodospirillaceae bacterium TMED8]|nr:MFS transporter [Magnetovibrio sp.]OUT51240.1 MAG: hypothetical protein CBB68_06355 [Rhodospirillaceae bacterium TMED8]|tara:strand:+ start:104 stop:1378 length:1275 start_codon:yes stop_codon:yes gene_type:complete
MNDPARTRVLEILHAVLRQNRALKSQADEAAGLSWPDHAFTRRATMTVIRRLGQIDDLILRCIEHPLPARAAVARDILRFGIAQILFMEVPNHAAVDTSVRLFKTHGSGGYGKLINAVLRRITREGGVLVAKQDAPRLNTPDWLWHTWKEFYGSKICRQIAAAHLLDAPLDLTCKADPGKWATRLGGRLMPGGTVRLNRPGAISNLAGYSDGAWWVQDTAAHWVSGLVGNVHGKSVIDLCAAPGGKTAALAAAGAQVTAVDRSTSRLKRLSENLNRLQLHANIIEADATCWVPEKQADVILLDAPCSATGTLRRHPDVGLFKTIQDVNRLASLQHQLLAHAANLVRPGGIVVYATCSLQPEEGEYNFKSVNRAGIPLIPNPISPDELADLPRYLIRNGTFRSFPFQLAEDGGIDGFFACRYSRI